ncbi:MAG: tRNA (adenosine(37)-N6)-threonylcarbamoyltransferase complex dimerization subunit type 1 TsaB [Actinobacteria bacterium]|nr:tRNA (adenosine(37)-N6)-threonylcarbamoyltransferase complex dimerization subunit type 1 TsaB [Actinomycetota bacterium]
MDPPLILCLDGSTADTSTALLSPGTGDWDVIERRHSAGRDQAKVLLALVDDMLLDLDVGPEALSGVVVGTGPGTFTGVRLTVATARALSLSLGVPVLGICTLGALVAGVLGQSQADLVVPVIDARRGQIFYGVYKRGVPIEPEAGTAHARGIEPDAAVAAQERWTRAAPFGVCSPADLGSRIMHEAAGTDSLSAVIVGERRTLAGDLPPAVRFVAEEASAEYLVRGQWRLVEPGLLPEGDRVDGWLLEELGLAREGGSVSGAMSPGEVGTPEAVKPVYVRSPDADIHITKMRDPWGTRPAKTRNSLE